MKRTEGERHAPQGRARTMSDEQERLVRERVAANGDYTMETVGVSVSLSDVLRELDAERAAHAETKAKLALADDALIAWIDGDHRRDSLTDKWREAK